MKGCWRHPYNLDGDNLRFHLNGDLGFSRGDRTENLRRAPEVPRLFNDAGTIVLVPVISPFRSDRKRAPARSLTPTDSSRST